MPEAVIVDAVRSPDRARLQGLADGDPSGRPRRLHRGLAARPQPGREARRRGGPHLRLRPPPGRAVLQHRAHDRPPVAAAEQDHRHDRPPLLRVEPPGDPDGGPAIKAGEGDTYIAAGVEHVSRVGPVERGRPAAADGRDRRERARGGEGPDPDTGVQERQDRRLERRTGRLHRHGRDRRERGGEVRRQARGHGRVRAALPGAPCRHATRGSSTARSCRSSFRTESTVDKDDGPRADSSVEKLPS